MEGSRPVSRVLSWTVIHLGRASPRASSDLPGSRAGHTILLPYLALLRVGFALPPPVTGGAVRSYRTFSPFPRTCPTHHKRVGKKRGSLFSVALSVGSRRPGVTWHPALWSPDFPRNLSSAGEKGQRDCPAGSPAGVWCHLLPCARGVKVAAAKARAPADTVSSCSAL